MAQFQDKGWLQFPFDQKVADWVNAARPAAEAAIVDSRNSEWYRSGGTWFVGVNSLFSGVWDAAQVSVMFPGYPIKDPTENFAAFNFRKDRFAAHVDGLRPVGLDRRRFLKEPHAFVLGLPLDETAACPLVVWEGSHEVMRTAFSSVFGPHPVEEWGDIDVTEIYVSARREVFDKCPIKKVTAKPGEAYLIHRLALHGVAPWGAKFTDPRRAIIYFRPECAGGVKEWLLAP